MDLSIVIPAFEESRKIGADIEAASGFLMNNHLAGEIIVVDDGSGDNTAEAAQKVQTSSPVKLNVIRLHQHRGKGYAVRAGIKQSTGEYVMFADSGCCVPYQNAIEGLELLRSRACDIAHGSRKLPASTIKKAQSLYRQFCSAVFRMAIRYIIRIPFELTDTQCGFKLYRGEVARALYERCVTDGFMFDVEIIMRAKRQGYRIKEFPVEWSCDRDSRLSPGRSLWRILAELISIKHTLYKTKSL